MPISDQYHNTEKLLTESIIRLNKPEEINDPFDLNIAPRCDLHDDDLRQYIRSEMHNYNFTQQEKDAITIQLNDSAFLKPEFVNRIAPGMLSGIRSHGIYCFSKYWQSILMWSHYADKHKGICVQFDFAQDSMLCKYLAEVEYSFEFPQVFFNDKNNYSKFFRMKYMGWQYEYEFRIIKPNSGKEFIKLPEQTIVGIFFGIKSEQSQIQNVLNWLSQRKVKPKLFKAIPVNQDYKIDRIPINWEKNLSAEDIVKAKP
jgi:hypothetical protein